MAPEPDRHGVLWSAATAREIVTFLAEDAEAGRLSRAEAMDLIDRVRDRAGPAPTSAPVGPHPDEHSPRLRVSKDG